ncbi:MAG: hypothetical protein ABH950_09025 [Candidatus Altiarchaeota archaeon]
MGAYTTIPVTSSTRERLKRFGHKGETYDELILKLLEAAEYKDILETHYFRLKEKSKFVLLE